RVLYESVRLGVDLGCRGRLSRGDTGRIGLATGEEERFGRRVGRAGSPRCHGAMSRWHLVLGPGASRRMLEPRRNQELVRQAPEEGHGALQRWNLFEERFVARSVLQPWRSGLLAQRREGKEVSRASICLLC